MRPRAHSGGLPMSVLAGWLSLLGCPEPASAQGSPFERGSWTSTVRAGGLWPLDPDRDVEVGTLGIDLGRAFRDDFTLSGELYFAAFDGRTSTGPGGSSEGASTQGLGGALTLRWHLVRRERWSAFLEYGYGLLGTLDEFPPGGTALNGTNHYGAGLTWRVSNSAQLVLGARQQHVSNGGGLGSDNPSYDGLGGYLGLQLTPGWLPDHQRVPPENLLPEPAARSARLDLHAGDADGLSVRGGALDAELRVSGPWFVHAGGSLDSVDDFTLSEYGGGLHRRFEAGVAGATWRRKELEVFTTDQFSLQGEHFVNDAATVVAFAGFEERNLAEERWAGGLLLRLYPTPDLMVESGLAFLDELSGDFDYDEVELPVSLEYQPAFARSMGRSVGLSLVVEDRLDDLFLIGLRLSFGEDRSLVERHRAEGFRRVRF